MIYCGFTVDYLLNTFHQTKLRSGQAPEPAVNSTKLDQINGYLP